MKINNTFEIKKISGGYKLIKQIKVRDKETKELKNGTDITFYGTMDQALVGFVNHSIGEPETLDDLQVKVKSIRGEIASLKAEIKAERGIIRSVTP